MNAQYNVYCAINARTNFVIVRYLRRGETMKERRKHSNRIVKRLTCYLLSVLVVMGAMPSAMSAYAFEVSTYPGATDVMVYDFETPAAIFRDGTAIATGNAFGSLTSDDGYLYLDDPEADSMSFHGDKHGLVVGNGDQISVAVGGNAVVTIELCEYGSVGTIGITKAAEGGELSAESIDLKVGTDSDTLSVAYNGDPTVLTLTINNSGGSYVHALTVTNQVDPIDMVPWVQKDFSFNFGGETISVQGAESDSDLAVMTQNGSSYYVSAEAAYLKGAFGGTTMVAEAVTGFDSQVIDHVEVTGGNTLVFVFADQASYPYSYAIRLQDVDNYVTPGITDIYDFNFAAGAIPSSLNKSVGIQSYTTDNGILTLLANGGTVPYWHDGSHGLAVYGSNQFEVKVAGDALVSFTLCAYSNEGTVAVAGLAEGGSGSFDSDQLKGTSDGAVITYTYTGDATTLIFTLDLSGESYLHGMTVKNQGTVDGSPVVNEPLNMPVEADATDMLAMTEVGHRLMVSQSDSESTIKTLTDLGYLLFEPMTGGGTLSFDVAVQAMGGSSDYGIFAGAFENADPITMVSTLGVRGDGNVRNIYTKAGTVSRADAGSINEPYSSTDLLKIRITMDESGWYSSVEEPDKTSDTTITYTKTALMDNLDASIRFGIAFSNVDAIITNLKLEDLSGTVLYDQNDVYDAVGSAPVVTAVSQPVVSEDRTSITLSWDGETPEDDGAYMVEVSTDMGSTYKLLSNQVNTKQYVMPVEEDGTYMFRVSGVCGSDFGSALTSQTVTVVKPLETPTLMMESGDAYIQLTWTAVDQATYYEIYRRSCEEMTATLLATVSDGLTYTDAAVVNETPYYYQIMAHSQDNNGNISEPLLSLPTSGHTGTYAYGEDASEVVLIEKSYDTVFDGDASLKGIVGEAGLMAYVVNGITVDQENLLSGEMFSFEAVLAEGRNVVELLFTNQAGETTRKHYSFVYLTHYDLLVDQNVQADNVTVFNTVGEAIASVDSNNAESLVIYIKEGTYVEHLVVATPNLHLIGQDREAVNIQFFDPVESPVGGSTSERCAVYIQSGAVNFTAENLSIENTYQYLGDGTISNESADALRVDADNSQFINVHLIGYQDTLNASINHQYYYQCLIEGNVDFIYGSAQALFEDCDLVFRYNSNKNAGYVTAPKTSENEDYGYIFYNTRITAQEGCSGSKYLLARPWGASGAATFINTYMSSIINTFNPYSDMSGNLAVEARFSEFYTYGAGFAINMNRPQISQAQSEAMLTPSSLGWNPVVAMEATGNLYMGDGYAPEAEPVHTYIYVDETADPNSTDDTGMGAYKMEGFAASYDVKGGGLLLETADDYHQAATAEEFLSALHEAKVSGQDTVIELTADIGLGSIEIGSALTTYSDVIKAASNQPLTHPTLLETGVSTLMLIDMSHITIYSKNGAKLLHTCIDMENTSDIIIRNIVFDELWEWDEGGLSNSGEVCVAGDYDRNDWDYVTIQKGSTGIWIDHCTFYKAYDGIVDIKKAEADHTSDVTISWSAFYPESEGSFFDDMMTALETNPENYPYYTSLLDEHGMTAEQIRGYCSGQKKSHLVGASDTEANIENLNLTLANNHYLDSMDRMPRLRGGVGHVFNTIINATGNYEMRNTIADEYASQKIVSNGVISTCGASVLIQNSTITDVMKALLSGNGSSLGGYIASENTLYYMDGVETELNVIDYAEDSLVMDTQVFKSQLPYTYNVYQPQNLETMVLPYVGAGVVSMGTTQWEKTEYDAALPEEASQNDDQSSGSSGKKHTSNTDDTDTADKDSEEDGTELDEDGTPAGAVIVFNDMGRFAWASQAVNHLVEKGILVGLGDGRFAPDTQIVRGDFILVIARALGFADASQESGVGFGDINADDYYYNAIVNAQNLGIVSGVGQGDFNPRGEITREDLMVMVYRALVAKGIIDEGGSADDYADFQDASMVSEYAQNAVGALVRRGFIQGDGTNLHPRDTASRAEVAVLVERILSFIE